MKRHFRSTGAPTAERQEMKLSTVANVISMTSSAWIERSKGT